MRKRRTDYTRCATSFPPEEIEVACTVLLGVLSGSDVSMLTRRDEYKNLLRRFERMKERAVSKLAELDAIADDAPDNGAPENGAAG
jgi:hypothetical protein